MQGRRLFFRNVLLTLLAALGLPRLAQAEKPGAQQNWQMIIDPERCTGCQSCVIACKAQSNTVVERFNTRILISESSDELRNRYLPVMCNHCESPNCARACPFEAISKLPNGIVVVDWERCAPEKCKPLSNGIGACVAACPYGANFLDSSHGDKVDKCDLCIDRVEKGLEPACVEACAPRARLFGDAASPDGEFAAYLGARQLHSRKPSVGILEYLKRTAFMKKRPNLKIETAVRYAGSRRAPGKDDA